MGGLKEVRERITSVSSTRQITSAMKMVSAAKLRRAQDAVTRMRPYATKLKEILENVSASVDASEGGAYAVEREVKTVLVVAISSNRGLCGGFNANISKAALKAIEKDFAGKEVKVIAIGKKSGEFLARRGYEVLEYNNDVFDNLNYDSIAPIAERIMEGFVDGSYDRVEIFYNEFVNAASQVATREQYLPVAPPQQMEGEAKKTADYIFEPNRTEIVLDLIPRSLKTQLYKGVLDSLASEHGARMTAMHKATDNATELLKELKLTYNKARQASITNEILEIVGGAAALEG
jgi:F-type H+-transporting ATPase subunit gamma